MSSVKPYLKQLKQPELLRLAKTKGARIDATPSKSELITILTPYVSQREVLELLRKPGETGMRGLIAGEHFERKVLSIFKRMGFSCQLNVHIKGSEFDIIGEKGGGWFSAKQWILAECKNRPKVVLNDFMKFVGKLETFRKKYPEDKVHGYLVTSGVFDPSVKSARRQHGGVVLKRVKA